MRPQIGQRVAVRFVSKDGELVKAKPVVRSIIAVYVDGQVKVSSGDVWRVRPLAKGAGADYEASF